MEVGTVSLERVDGEHEQSAWKGEMEKLDNTRQNDSKRWFGGGWWCDRTKDENSLVSIGQMMDEKGKGYVVRWMSWVVRCVVDGEGLVW